MDENILPSETLGRCVGVSYYGLNLDPSRAAWPTVVRWWDRSVGFSRLPICGMFRILIGCTNHAGQWAELEIFRKARRKGTQFVCAAPTFHLLETKMPKENV